MKPTGLKRGKMDRKFGQKLFLKPFRGASPKSAFTRRAYKPGAHGQERVRRRSRSEEYGIQLLEKQRVRALYGISDKLFKRIVRDSEARVQRLEGTHNALDLITEALEMRLDSAIYRCGIAPSRSMARQYISHGHILVNGRRARVRSHLVKQGDVISVRELSREKGLFVDLAAALAKTKAPAWLAIDAGELSVKVTGKPDREEAMADVELSKVVEFYAR